MRYYASKRITKQEFIVVKHSLPHFENTVIGVRYREGYAVVAKESPEHKNLKKMRPKAVVKELPITFLENLKSVINDKQVEYIWGKIVYQYYLKKKSQQESGIEKVQEGLNKLPTCAGETQDGTPCKNKIIKGSEYCRKHIYLDPRLKEDFEKMPMLPKKEKKIRIGKLIDKKIKNAES